MKNLKEVLSFLIFTTFGYLRVCNCVIILESGNPARFIRGAFVDVNQPEFFGASVEEKQENDFPVHESVHTLTANIVENLAKFNKAMTNAMKKEVEKTDAASAVNTCRFSRSRMTALRIQNTLEDQLTKVAIANLDESSSATNNVMQLTSTMTDVTQSEFNQMIEDLHQYDEAVHGKEAMVNFQKALSNFHSLQLIVSKVE